MPRLVDPASIPARVPTARGPIPSYRGGEGEAALVQAGVATAADAQRRIVEIEADQDERDNYDLAHARSVFLQGKVALDAERPTEENYVSFEQDYATRLTEMRKTVAETLSGRAKNAFLNTSGVDMARGVAGAKGHARVKEVDVGRASLDGVIDANMDAALNAADEETATRLLRATQDAIDASAAKGYITSKEAGTAKRKLVEQYALGRVATMTPAARFDALSQGMNIDNGRVTFAKTSTFLDFIDPDDRVKLLKAADAQIAAQAREARLAAERARKAAERVRDATREKAANDFLERMENPGEEPGPLTIDDVLASPLKATQKRVFLNALKDEAEDNEKATNLKFYTAAMVRIAGGDLPIDKFPEVLLPILGNGLTVKDYKNLYSFAETIQGETDNPRLKGFIAMAKSKITESTIMANDARGDELFYMFTVKLTKRIAEARKRDVPFGDLFDPESDEYLGKHVTPYVRNLEQRIKDRANSVRGAGR